MKFKLFHTTLFWLIFACVITALMSLVHPISSKAYSVLHEFVWEISFALVWIPATPFVMRVSKIYPVNKKFVVRNGLILFFTGFVLSLLLCLGHSALVFLFRKDIHEFSADIVFNSLYYNLDKMLIIYTVLVLMQHVFDYYEQIREKEIKASHLEAQLVQAQMQALKAQLHPHFLFNTLNAIVSLIHKDPDTAEMMIIRLSEFLRMTLEGSEKNVVSVTKELEFARAYLEIEKIRFHDRLTIQFNMPLEMMDAQVPYLILQPLIENAVKHGVSQNSENGFITISIKKESDRLILSVCDNGNTMSDDTAIVNEGIGLSNTRARLLRLYGNNAALLLQPKAPHGMEVIISLPYTINFIP